MQVYLYQNNQQEGPFTLPRISARLVAGDLDSATLAWYDGLDTWYPLNHEKWKALGIVAPAPIPKAEKTEAQNQVDRIDETSTSENGGDSKDESANSLSGENEEVHESKEQELTDSAGTAFSSYSEEDFKPPSYEEMEKEMAELRVRRAAFPEAIGRRVHEINFRDEEIEDALNALEKALANGKDDAKAFASLGYAVLSAGLNDPGLSDLRDEEQEVSDRMLNLQMQLRRMGGGKRVKKPSSLLKWIFLGFAVILIGGSICFAIFSG